MTPIDEYVLRVLQRLPPDAELRASIGAELRGHIAERLEHGHPADEALRQLGDPAVLAESYLAAVPLVAAPFWDRVWAKLADFAIITIAVSPVLWLSWRAGNVALIATSIFLLAFAIPLYAILAEYQFARTVGKHLFGLRVVRESGARISLGQSVVRQLPAFFQVFWVDAMFALFTERHQRAFELLSKTRVVLKPEAAS